MWFMIVSVFINPLIKAQRFYVHYLLHKHNPHPQGAEIFLETKEFFNLKSL